MWLEVGEAEDSMSEAVFKEPGCGWRKERQRTVRLDATYQEPICSCR